MTEDEKLVLNLLKGHSPMDLNELKDQTGLSNKKWDKAIKGLSVGHQMENVRKGLWKTVLSLKDGEVKFRADGSWKYNWGGRDFPDGLGRRDGPNIPISAGQYIITFEEHSELYSFTKID